MPPKKKAGKAAATPAKATASAQPDDAPATITAARGREIDTTAAAGRSRRAAAAPPTKATAVAPEPAAARKRGRPAKNPAVMREGDDASEGEVEAEGKVEVEPPRKRGRPTKAEAAAAKKTATASEVAPEVEVEPPRKRGRPTKAEAAAATTATVTKTAAAQPGGRKRGRPAKVAVPMVEEVGEVETEESEAELPVKKGEVAKAETTTETAETTAARRGSLVPEITPKRGRGRPRKGYIGGEADVVEGEAGGAAEDEAAVPQVTPKRGRGRPKKFAAKKAKDEEEEGSAQPANDAPAVPREQKAPPKKRGRPPFGGETTKIKGDDVAAADQLEEELVDAAQEDAAPVEKGKAMKGKGKKKAAAIDDEAETEPKQQELNDDMTVNYWLMKAEQEDRNETLKNGDVKNMKFTIDDLASKAGPEPWDGVRNPTACKNMKEMKQGDLAFFYASGGKQGRVPGITGIMEVVQEAMADTSAFDEESAGYVENAKMRGTQEKPRWFMVHVEFRKKLAQPVTLAELKKHASDDGPLSKMQELTAARLSVSRISKGEWNFITNQLITGYVDDAAIKPRDEAKDSAAPLLADDPTITITTDPTEPPSNHPNPLSSDALPTPTDLPAILAATAAKAALPQVLATNEAGPTAAASSNPATTSRARSARPASRQGSAAPSGHEAMSARGRSRTPSQRAGSAQPAGKGGRGGGGDGGVKLGAVNEGKE